MNVLVDDSDPLVNYSTSWVRPSIGQSEEFNGTVHEPLALGESATLAFNGTSITVFGTIASNGDAGMHFSIDGGPPGSFDVDAQSAQGHNMRFWTSPALEDTLHNFTIIVDHDSLIGTTRTLFLDYFVYTTTSTAGKSVLIDDSETGVITYSPDWKADTNSDGSLNRTQHVTGSADSWVTLSFEGTQISFFGPKSMPSSVIIDESQTKLTTQQIPKNPNPLFQSPVLPQGNHTMNITFGNSTTIDYFLVTTELDPPLLSPSSSSVGLTDPEPTGVSNPPAGAPPGGLQMSKPLPIAAIVGGTVGGLMMLALILAAIFIRKRSRRRQARSIVSDWMGIESDDSPVTAVRPFVPSITEETGTEPPPPYTLKYRP
ncbi:hypothetical protein MVEN_02285700 [Mycena venus]|uniref:Uncharacterized protein n=1 Tax=Mycena venus TaxID=2733690 RepID=A0A8H7CGF8_9AGAR|nr:hypothetical protein MVEN_02285700 [Mycena venus]